METIIGDHNWQTHVTPPAGLSKGLIPRDYKTHPQGCYSTAPAFDMKVIPRSEWSARIKDKTAQKSQLSDRRLAGMPDGSAIKSRDQNGKGYCWAHSTTSACIVVRAVNNDPYADLSAYAIACIIKSYRDEGGWGALSMDWVVTNGIPTSEFWPQQSMNRSNDNAAMRANAALHKVADQWADLNAAEYDRSLTFDQVATLLLSDIPVVGDFNWWSHSVCLLDLIEASEQRDMMRHANSGKILTLQEFDKATGLDTEAGGYGVRIWNSWGDGWSDRGMGLLTGTKAIPDGAVAPRRVNPSIN